MNDKEKQIEEMAKDVCKNVNTKMCADGTCPKTWECPYSNTMAKILIKKGYRNCKDKVVLSREEYSDYLILQKNHEFIREKAKELQADNERLYKNIGKFKEIVRKETAEKYHNEMELVIKACMCMHYISLEHGQALLNDNNILAKQFGVDIKE